MARPFPIILTGPTASGKTALSMEIAKRLSVRVISADSMQVYRRLDIGTAKPTLSEQATVKHYGLDLCEPVRSFSVAEYLAHAVPAIQETLEAGEWPLIVGGTRLYLQALTAPFTAASPPDREVRERLVRSVDRPEALWDRLREVDPASAERLHPNDTKRVLRALEVFLSTGERLSDLQERSRARPSQIEARWFALVCDREQLYRKVEQRTIEMIRAGWLDEVRQLLELGYGAGLEQIKAHGYRELARVVRGEMVMADAVQQINQKIRNYVRYQSGWITHQPAIFRLDAGDAFCRLIEILATAIQSA